MYSIMNLVFKGRRKMSSVLVSCPFLGVLRYLYLFYTIIENVKLLFCKIQ